MAREEQIKEAALKECSSFDIPDKQVRFKGVNSAYGLGFCEGAMWADENRPVDWQQVRIQTAIAAMQALRSNTGYNQCTPVEIAKYSVTYADALVKELKGE